MTLRSLKSVLLFVVTLALMGCAWRGMSNWKEEQRRRANPIQAISGGGDDRFVLQSLNLDPSNIPDPLRVDQEVVVSVDPVWVSGARCEGACTVSWKTNQPSLAKWTRVTKSGTKRSATLVSLTPGQVQLRVEICLVPEPLFKPFGASQNTRCQRRSWHRAVTQ